MNTERPVNLNLAKFKFPLAAYTSILHRASGVFLFFMPIFLLYGLEQSLNSAESFNALKSFLKEPFAKLILWGFLSAFIYHLVAGIKHLIMDFGFAEEKESSRIAALLTLIISGLLILLTGVWLW